MNDSKPAANRRSRNAVRLATTTARGGDGVGAPRSATRHVTAPARPLRRTLSSGGIDGVGVVVEGEHLPSPEARGGDGEHARARAGVDHASAGHVESPAAPRRHVRVDWWWPVPKPIEGSITITHAASGPPAACAVGTSHGGATTKRPTVHGAEVLLDLDGPAFVLDATWP